MWLQQWGKQRRERNISDGYFLETRGGNLSWWKEFKVRNKQTKSGKNLRQPQNFYPEQLEEYTSHLQKWDKL